MDDLVPLINQVNDGGDVEDMSPNRSYAKIFDSIVLSF